MSNGKVALKKQDTYVYVDVSNIRSACFKSLNLKLDFARLYWYFKHKYSNLKEARYYEGMVPDDERKQRSFDFLQRIGWTICPMERKAYDCIEMEEREMECPDCGKVWREEVENVHRIMKSNVDVYLATDMIVRASQADHPIRLILVSCDGDYAEAIKNVIMVNDNVSVAVLATSYVSDREKNSLSVRLKGLLREIPDFRFSLNYIDALQDRVKYIRWEDRKCNKGKIRLENMGNFREVSE